MTPRVLSLSGSALSEEVEVVQDETCAMGKSFLSRPEVPLFSLSEELVEVEAGFALVVVEWWDELDVLWVLVGACVEETFVLLSCVGVEAMAVFAWAVATVEEIVLAARADETPGALQRVPLRRCVGAARTEARAKARMKSRVLKAYMVV